MLHNPIVIALLLLAAIILVAGVLVKIIDIFYTGDAKYKSVGQMLIGLAALVLCVLVIYNAAQGFH